jgi:glycosyl transferase family 61
VGSAVKTFANIVVHPSQEVLRHLAGGAFFRGGPDWPHFAAQIFARHCWQLVPIPVDSRPYPAPGPVEEADRGIWCGPVSNHFGHMIADFGMRIAASARLDDSARLVFSLWPEPAAEPPEFFWQLLGHLGVARDRVLLVRRPTRFSRLSVVPQAERRFGGAPSRAHLALMDEIAARSAPRERDIPSLFVSRARWPKGRFAGEPCLDDAFAAAGVAVCHPETLDVAAQLQLYRRARRLIFSEGSALHALQLLGRLDAEIIILKRRPGPARFAAGALRRRARALHYVRAASGLIYGLTVSGRRQGPAGVTLLDVRRCLAGLKALGIDLAPFWDERRYRQCRDAEIAAWIEWRLKTAAHPGERRTIEKRLAALSLRHLMP